MGKQLPVLFTTCIHISHSNSYSNEQMASYTSHGMHNSRSSNHNTTSGLVGKVAIRCCSIRSRLFITETDEFDAMVDDLLQNSSNRKAYTVLLISCVIL